MKIGLVGYTGSGKSTLFEWLTGEAADPAAGHTTQTAMAPVPDARVEPLCEIYRPKRVTQAALEIVDTPGLRRSHEGSAATLGMIREGGCLVQVVAAFEGSETRKDVTSFEEDLALADWDIVSGRVERLRESIKKPRPDRDQQKAELAVLESLLPALERGQAVHELELTKDQQKAIRAFQLLTEKPRLVMVNVADDEMDLEQFQVDATDRVPIVAAPLRLECELARMSEEESREFRREMGLAAVSRDAMLRTIMEASEQILFFTAGTKEFRSRLIRRESTAVEAAESVHSDMARGFIRAEVIRAEDLIRLGSLREVKAQHLARQEPRDYVVQDGDIVTIRFNV
jgi:ribosome-binding ATPase YchF (GTP1/OBG family)